MPHSTYTHQGRVNSQLLMVGSQIANLILDFSFVHNLCCRCPNSSCEAILDIYASRPFQQYKKNFKARCFDPCNLVLNFRKSQRTPKSPFRKCECHLHIPSKWGCDTCLAYAMELRIHVSKLSIELVWVSSSTQVMHVNVESHIYDM